MKTKLKLLICLICVISPLTAYSVELYLPVKLDPVMEAKIERLMVSANLPIIKRPIAIHRVKEALKIAGEQNPQLSKAIERYLDRFDQRAALTHSQVRISHDSGENTLKANARGEEAHSSYSASASAYWKPTNWMAVNVGGVIFDGDSEKKNEFAEGTYLSLGNRFIQADIGMRAHWFGPFQESDMLLTTNASAVPGITLSNSQPFTPLGIRYEVFMAEMSASDSILSEDRSERLTGNPRLMGFHTSFEPVAGFAIGFNRLMQYGGADRDDSVKGLMKAFFKVKESDNIGDSGSDFGNQVSSINTRYTFAGDFPISVYMEYAGEDTSYTSDVHLGNTALMFGLHLPKLSDSLDFTYEFAEWQNGWYVNTNYGDGLRQYETIIGHWGANQRIFADAVGSTNHLAKLNWYIDSDKSLLTRFRQASNRDYGAFNYETGYELDMEYSQLFHQLTFAITATTGKDVFGDDYNQLSGAIRW